MAKVFDTGKAAINKERKKEKQIINKQLSLYFGA